MFFESPFKNTVFHPSCLQIFVNPSWHDALAVKTVLELPSMFSTGTGFGSTVTTTLSEDLSGYIRSEKLVNRLYELFGQNIQVEVSKQRLSKSSLGTAAGSNEFLVPPKPLYFPSPEGSRRSKLSMIQACSCTYFSDIAFYSSSMK